MKRSLLIGIFIALFAAIIAIAWTWSETRTVIPAAPSDTTSTPNPGPQVK